MKIDKSLLQAAYTTDSEADGLYAEFDVMGQIKVLSLRQEGLIIRTLRLEPRLLAGSSQRHRSFEISKDTSDSAEEQYGSWVKTEIREMEDRVNWVSRCSFCQKSADEVQKIIAGPSVYICSECILLCSEILRT